MISCHLKKGIAILVSLAISVFCATALCAEKRIVLETMVENLTVNTVSTLIITSPQGVKTYIDAVGFSSDKVSSLLSDPNTIFTQTINAELIHGLPPIKDCNGTNVLQQLGVFPFKDTKIERIAASRYDNTIDGSNVIVIIDVAGIRIVHFGDCGQDELTQAQLKQIDRVDVALYAMEWNNSGNDLRNKKAFKVLKQVDPTIVIPTHIATTSAVKLLDRDWPCESVPRNKFSLSASTLTKKQTIFWGGNMSLAEKSNVPVSKDL